MTNRNPQVDEHLQKMNHPLEREINRVREIILSIHPDIQETIKWKVPTFMYGGNIASFMNAKKFVSLMFHKGASFKDKYGLLEGEGKVTRVARFQDMEDIEKKKKALMAIIEEWIAMQNTG